MRIVNLTEHNVNILDEDGKIKISFKPSGHVARIKQQRNQFMTLETKQGDIPIVKDSVELDFGGVEIEPLTIYIVSWLFLQELKFQKPELLSRFVAPNTLNQPKTSTGGVAGVSSLLVYQ